MEKKETKHGEEASSRDQSGPNRVQTTRELLEQMGQDKEIFRGGSSRLCEAGGLSTIPSHRPDCSLTSIAQDHDI